RVHRCAELTLTGGDGRRVAAGRVGGAGRQGQAATQDGDGGEGADPHDRFESHGRLHSLNTRGASARHPGRFAVPFPCGSTLAATTGPRHPPERTSHDARGGGGTHAAPGWHGEPVAYFERLGVHRYRATEHTGGAWDLGTQHIAPALGLLAHAVER